MRDQQPHADKFLHTAASAAASIVFAAFFFSSALAQSTSGEGVQLNNMNEANSYFAGQEREAWRGNAEKLAGIDKAYSEKIKALSAENSERLNAILAENSAAHKELAARTMDSSERAKETQRIQADTKTKRDELASWYQGASQQARDEHSAERAAQSAATTALLEQLGERRAATLQRLINGPVNLENMPALSFPTTEDASDETAVNTGGIDVAGTVPLDTPADAIIADANQDRSALHERLFAEEQERRRRADEEAASQMHFIQTAQARANTLVSTPAEDRQLTCESNPDADGDGVIDAACGGADCDDRNPNRYPGNTEVADEFHVDEDCDPSTFGNVDNDGDGYFSAYYCNGDNCGTDCDDNRASTHPGAAEVCNYIADDCGGEADEEVLAVKYLDRDGDWYGDPARPLNVCPQTYQSPYGEGEWLSERGIDCDDTDSSVWQNCGQ